MRIVLTGGGTGGHITPLLAVASELKRLHPTIHIMYIGEKGGSFVHLAAEHPAIDEVHVISAGKFRRYHGESLLIKLLDISTNAKNIRDTGRVTAGYLQALRLLKRLRPDVVFLKGGFVGVPVGLAAAKLHIPFVTHDSDALPGLANRSVARWASLHAVALPVEEYSYPKESTRQVGVIVEPGFKEVSERQRNLFRRDLGIPSKAKVLLVTGGSTGAVRLNKAIIQLLGRLLQDYSDLYVIHQVGKGKGGIYGEFKHGRLQVHELMRPMYAYTGAADVVVTRASANTLAELGTQRKPVIVVASPFLSDGHQLHNARRLEEKGAALSIAENASGTDVTALDAAIRSLLSSKIKRQKLADTLHSLTVHNAATRMAEMLIEVATRKR